MKRRIYLDVPVANQPVTSIIDSKREEILFPRKSQTKFQEKKHLVDVNEFFSADAIGRPMLNESLVECRFFFVFDSLFVFVLVDPVETKGR